MKNYEIILYLDSDHLVKRLKKTSSGEFPDGLVVRTMRFPYRRHGFDPWWGN